MQISLSISPKDVPSFKPPGGPQDVPTTVVSWPGVKGEEEKEVKEVEEDPWDLLI